jgi:hypothetical protein
MISAKDDLWHVVECLTEEEVESCLEACRRALGDNPEGEEGEGPQAEGQLI